MGEKDSVEILRPDFAHIDTLNAHEFTERYGSIPGDKASLLIDMSLVKYVDSSGLGALLSLVRETLSRGGRIAICAAQPSVSVLFRMVKFSKLLPIFETLEEGLTWAAGESAK